jgi:hypothetical protein
VSKYILAFRSQPDRTPQPDEGQQWETWFTGLGAAITDMGSQVGTVRTLRSENGGEAATAVLTGYVVINAADTDEAARLVGGSPGLRNGSASRSVSLSPPDRPGLSPERRSPQPAQSRHHGLPSDD